MPLVDLPNGTQLDFPEDMSQDDMRNAIQKNFPEYAPKSSALSTIGTVASSVYNGIKDDVSSLFSPTKSVMDNAPAPSVDAEASVGGGSPLRADYVEKTRNQISSLPIADQVQVANSGGQPGKIAQQVVPQSIANLKSMGAGNYTPDTTQDISRNASALLTQPPVEDTSLSENPEEEPDANSTLTTDAMGNVSGSAGGYQKDPMVDPNQVDAIDSFARMFFKSQASTQKIAALALTAPVVLLTKLRNAVTGDDNTAAQDFLFGTFVDPNQKTIDWASIKPDEKQSILADVAGSLGSTLNDLPLMLASGYQSQLSKAGVAAVDIAPTAMNYVSKALGAGFDTMRPIMIKAGTEKFEDIVSKGGTSAEAIAGASTAAMWAGFQGSAAMSVEGNVFKRLATGLPFGAVLTESNRVIQNAASSEAMQQPFSLRNLAVGSASNAVLAGAMGHSTPIKPPSRTELGYAPNLTPIASGVREINLSEVKPQQEQSLAAITSAPNVDQAISAFTKANDVADQLLAVRPQRVVTLEKLRDQATSNDTKSAIQEQINELSPTARNLLLDESNNPKTFYHGTDADTQELNNIGLGNHFTSDPNVARSFADSFENGGKIGEYNLNINNPLRIKDHGGNHTSATEVVKSLIDQKILPEDYLNDDFYKRLLANDKNDPFPSSSVFENNNIKELENIRSLLQAKGYDGLVYDNKTEGGGDTYVPFSRSQIISKQRSEDPQIAARITTLEKLRDQSPSSVVKGKLQEAIDQLRPPVQSVEAVAPDIFPSPHEHKLQDHLAKAEENGISIEHATTLAPQETLDHVTGFNRGEEKAPTVQRALDYVNTTGDTAHYIDADIGNLTGLNAHFDNNHSLANPNYRAMADIFASEMGAAGKKAVMLRQGGDEVSAVVIGGTNESIRTAIENTKRRIQEYAERTGLDQIPNSKHPDQPEFTGIGIHLGQAEIKPGMSPRDVFDTAASELNSTKINGFKTDNQQLPLFSRNDNNALAKGWQELAKHDDLFQFPISKAKNIEDIFREASPRVAIQKNKGPMPADITQAWDIYPKDGKGDPITSRQGWVMQYKDGKVEINVANFATGDAGVQVYNAVGNYAHNNHLVFEGDRFGVSDDAISRRLENLTSLAMKFGSTDFIGLHPDQIKKFGIDWKPGDTQHNLNEMLHASYNHIAEVFPEIKDIVYDFHTGEFKDKSSGLEYDDRGIEAISADARARGFRGGSSTIKRAALSNTFLQDGNGKAWGFDLPQNGGVQRNSLDAPLLKTAYSRNENQPGTGLSTAEASRILSTKFGKGFDTLVNKGILKIIGSHADLPEAARQGANGDESGVYHGGTAYLIAGNQTRSQIIRDVIHEVGEHHGLEAMLGEKAYASLFRDITRMKESGNKVVSDIWNDVTRLYGVPEGSKTFIKEVIAKLGETAEGRATSVWTRISIAAKQFLNTIGLRNFNEHDIADLVVSSLHRSMKEESLFPGVTNLHSGLNPTEAVNNLKESLATGKLSQVLLSPKKSLTNLKVALVPMSEGSDAAMKVATDFADQNRKATNQWNRFDTILKKNFTEEQLGKMWDAADQENDILRAQRTDPSYVRPEGAGLDSLSPNEKRVVDTLHTYGEELLDRAKQNGMLEETGVDYWAPRMIVQIGEKGEISKLPSKQKATTSNEGKNLSTYASSAQHRKYETTAETEAAAQSLAEEGNTAQVVRNIRTMPMAMARLERAISGRELINQIKALGQAAGKDTVTNTEGPDYFTINHPAMKSWRPVMKDGSVLKDENGNTVLESYPLHISKEFEGPLRAVLTTDSKIPMYKELMTIKSKSMGLIMMSPMIHNAVEYGRAFPAMLTTSVKDSAKNILTLGAYTYVSGNRAKRDPQIMNDAIEHGLVPIGGNGSMLDITGIADGSSMEVGKSWTAKALGYVTDMVAGEKASTAVKKGVDAAGKFWHETLLWDRIADLQVGLYVSMRTSLINKGMSEFDAATLAAHFANRYAGSLPAESMSQNARELLNLTLFSRSFTMGNLGAMKDMFGGLPKNRQAQIKLNAIEAAKAFGKSEEEAMKAGDTANSAAQSIARKKAIAVVALDIGLMYIANSLTQNWLRRLDGDEEWQAQLAKYGLRYEQLVSKFSKDPISILTHPFNSVESLSATSENPEGKKERIKWGEDDRGNTIYMRLPFGKIGEEFVNYMTPGGILKQTHNKLSPFAKPLYEIFANNNGIGRKIYDESKDATVTSQFSDVVGHFLKAQIPYDQMQSAYDLAAGHGNGTDKRKVLGPFVGLTFSENKGGDAVSEMYAASREHEDKVSRIMPDVNRAIKLGNEDKAVELMQSVNMTQREIMTTLRHIEEPTTRLNKSSLRRFNRHATDEQKEKMSNLR